MKRQIIKTALVFVFGILSFNQALAQSAKENSLNKQEIADKLEIKKDEFRIRRTETAISNSPDKIAPENRFSFNLGSSLSMTMLYASFVGEDIAMEDKAIVELVFLIDSLEGLPQADALQKTLKNIVRYNCKGQQCVQEIQSVTNTFQKELKGDMQWYFNAGMTASNLYISSFGDDTSVTKNLLAQMQDLTNKAPKTIPVEVLNQMKTVTQYIAKEKLSKDDYTAIGSKLDGLINTITA